MAAGFKTCSVCGERFLLKGPQQIRRDDGDPTFFCSQECREADQEATGRVTCTVCGDEFEPEYAYQRAHDGDEVRHFCSMECRKPASDRRKRHAADARLGPMRLAVMNQKGGTGKTTTSVSLAAGLAEDGHRVLLIDVDSQGHVGISLGVEGDATLYDILVDDVELESVVTRARPNLDVVDADESLASAEIFLARRDGARDRLLRERIRGELSYDFVLLDCGPSLSLLNKNALTFADDLIVPVACDFLSLVGVKQVMKTMKQVNKELVHPIDILGILPTFYDLRNNISDESVKTLKGHFHDKVLPPIRVNTRLKEAPQHNKTIFEYAPNSRGAKDYRKLVDWLLDQDEARHEKAV